MLVRTRVSARRGLDLPWSVPFATVGLLTAVAVWTMAVVFLALFHLDSYPTIWFDEGQALHVPKALVQYGIYADVSSEGFRYFGPTAAVGPTVLVPIALVFKLIGVGLLQARLVMAVYLVAGVALFTLLALRRYGPWTGLPASLLLVSSPGINLLYLGRQVLGEVPALTFFALAVLLWWRSMEAHRARSVWLGAAGLAFALAALTKNQFSLILAPTFVLLALADRLYYRRLSLRFFVVPFLAVGGAVLAGLFLQLLPLLGKEELARTAALWRDSSAGAIFVFSPGRLMSSLKFLVGGDALAHWAIPALFYGLFLARDRSLAGLQHAFLAAFAAVGLGWFAVASIGWPRYAFPALAVTALLVAKLFADVVKALSRAALATDFYRLRVAAGAVLIGSILMAGSPLVDELRSVAAAADSSPQLMAAYLEAQVPHSAVIETWEPELGFLTDHTYHYPPTAWLDRAVRSTWLQTGASSVKYDPVAEVQPAYLVVGRFGEYTAIYSQLIASLGAPPIASIGPYDLYQLPR